MSEVNIDARRVKLLHLGERALDFFDRCRRL